MVKRKVYLWLSVAKGRQIVRKLILCTVRCFEEWHWRKH